MIQRIQSVFLLLTTILAGLFLTGEIFKFFDSNNSEFLMNMNGFFRIGSARELLPVVKTIPLQVLSLSIPVVSICSIFLFKNRKIQLKVVLLLFILNLLLIGIAAFYGISFMNRYQLNIVPRFEMFIPFVNAFLIILAYRGIKNDENLVRSYDRLR